MIKMGLPMPVLWAWWIGILEFAGGLLLAVGLFTRIVAAMFVLEMAVICSFVLWPNYGWTNRGIEYPMMMGTFALAMVLRGGGAPSLDRRIGREF
jgi:putative oxidoreductase